MAEATTKTPDTSTALDLAAAMQAQYQGSGGGGGDGGVVPDTDMGTQLNPSLQKETVATSIKTEPELPHQGVSNGFDLAADQAGVMELSDIVREALKIGTPEQPQKPYIKIIEEPAKKTRFRYKADGHAGTLHGEKSTTENKSHVKVQVVGYQGDNSMGNFRFWAMFGQCFVLAVQGDHSGRALG